MNESTCVQPFKSRLSPFNVWVSMADAWAVLKWTLGNLNQLSKLRNTAFLSLSVQSMLSAEPLSQSTQLQVTTHEATSTLSSASHFPGVTGTQPHPLHSQGCSVIFCALTPHIQPALASSKSWVWMAQFEFWSVLFLFCTTWGKNLKNLRITDSSHIKITSLFDLISVLKFWWRNTKYHRRARTGSLPGPSHSDAGAPHCGIRSGLWPLDKAVPINRRVLALYQRVPANLWSHSVGDFAENLPVICPNFLSHLQSSRRGQGGC